MAFTERLNDEQHTSASQVRELKQQVQELAECLLDRSACQEQVNGELHAEVAALNDKIAAQDEAMNHLAAVCDRSSTLFSYLAEALADAAERARMNR